MYALSIAANSTVYPPGVVAAIFLTSTSFSPSTGFDNCSLPHNHVCPYSNRLLVEYEEKGRSGGGDVPVRARVYPLVQHIDITLFISNVDNIIGDFIVISPLYMFRREGESKESREEKRDQRRVEKHTWQCSTC